MRTRIIVIGLLLAALFLLAGVAQATSSANYRLDWVVPLSGGGGAAVSDGYILDASYGQAFIGTRASENYRVVLGFWSRAAQHLPVFLPVIGGRP